jgi:hypothetical protein
VNGFSSPAFVNPDDDASQLTQPFWNAVIQEAVEWTWDQVEYLVDAMTKTGVLPFMQPAPPEVEYQQLMMLRNAGHPAYWQSEAAQKRLMKLSFYMGQGIPEYAMHPPTNLLQVPE